MKPAGQIPKPNAALDALQVFSGHWHTTGEYHKIAPAPNVKLKGTADYKWMPGAFFMLYNWERLADDGSAHIGFAVIGYDERNAEFFAQHFDNMGYTEIYRLYNKGNSWIWLGEKKRATVTFENDTQFSEVWETNTANGWMPLYTLDAQRFSAYEHLYDF